MKAQIKTSDYLWAPNTLEFINVIHCVIQGGKKKKQLVMISCLTPAKANLDTPRYNFYK